jgi:beta-galactosidase
MKITYIPALAALLIVLTGGAIMGGAAEDWENPKMFNQNKEQPHVTYIPYTDIPSAVKDMKKTSPFYYSLNVDSYSYSFVLRPYETGMGDIGPGHQYR